MNDRKTIAVSVAAIAISVSAAIGLAFTGPGHGPCYASEPVYAGTVAVGTLTVDMQPGQSVLTPDGDTLRCTRAGLGD